jgi:hypothetical protein
MENEIKIGNLLNHNDRGVIEIKGIEAHCGDFKLRLENEDWLYLKNCEPISITDDWLIKLGFEKIKSHSKKQSGKSSKVWSYDNNFYLTLEKHHIGEYDEGQTFYPTLHIKELSIYIVFKHVHVLQNVFYFLRAEELVVLK